MFHFHFLSCIVCILCFSYLVCTFHIEELKWINYEVDISVTPVKREEVNYPTLQVTSRNGQEFQCKLPQLNEDDMFEKEVVNEKNVDVLELLKPMKTSCLTKSKDWWTYEFCYGHYIKQFHVEDGEIIGDVLTLGLYESDMDWKNETALQERFKHAKQKYHSQFYTNGTKCDITGQPRNAEVRIYCEEDSFDYIHRVDEPGTCSYIIIIHSSRLCAHPLLKPLPTNKAHPIECHPLLNEEQYANYLKKVEEEKILAEERRSQWLLEQQERLQILKNENLLSTSDKKENAPEDNSKSKTTEGKTSEEKASEDKTPKDSKETPKQTDAEIEELLFVVFDKEMEILDKWKNSYPTEEFASIITDVQKHFDTILEEAKENVRSGSPGDAKPGEKYMKKLKSFFDQVFEKLEKGDKNAVKTAIKQSKAKATVHEPEFLEEPTKEAKDLEYDIYDYDNDENDLDEVEFLEDPTKDKYDYLDRLYARQNKEKDQENNPDEDSVKIISQSRTALLDDDKVQVRIRRLDRKSSDADSKMHEIDFEQRKKLEQAVKEKLEIAGLDTGGRRIEVKIIAAGHYNNEGDKEFQSLTDEETDQFQNMIMALLTGQQEAVQEMKRHKKLEDSYKYTWDNKEAEDDNKDD